MSKKCKLPKKSGEFDFSQAQDCMKFVEVLSEGLVDALEDAKLVMKQRLEEIQRPQSAEEKEILMLSQLEKEPVQADDSDNESLDSDASEFSHRLT